MFKKQSVTEDKRKQLYMLTFTSDLHVLLTLTFSLKQFQMMRKRVLLQAEARINKQLVRCQKHRKKTPADVANTDSPELK